MSGTLITCGLLTGSSAGKVALVLPSLACLSDADADALRQYATQGGGIVATFETSLFDPLGGKRDDFLLADVFRARDTGS